MIELSLNQAMSVVDVIDRNLVFYTRMTARKNMSKECLFYQSKILGGKLSISLIFDETPEVKA